MFENMFNVDDVVILKLCVKKRLSFFKSHKTICPSDDCSEEIAYLIDLVSRLDLLIDDMT